MTRTSTVFAALVATLAVPAVAADPATFQIRSLTPETALKAAQAALGECRRAGHQVSVALVDRSGLVQVVLRDRFAGAHSPDAAINKAWTAVSFRTNTTELEKATRPGSPSAGVRHWPNVAVVGGGMKIEAGGSILAGIGVSGAPGGDADDACASAGIKAIADNLEF